MMSTFCLLRWRLQTVAGMCAMLVLQLTMAEPIAHAQRQTSSSFTGESLRTFDPQDFALAYDVLLGTGDLKRAFLVAQKAVQASPEDRQWRRKLAQVSIWTQQPEIAAQQWLALFLMGDKSSDTLMGVIHDAHLVNQPLVALQAWGELVKRQTLTNEQWQDVYNLYDMAAEPRKGSQFFESEFARNGNPILLEYAGRLSEYAGDDERALRLYTERTTLEPFSMDLMVKAVVLMIRSNKLQNALDLLQAHQQQVPAQASEYWKLLSQVAWDAGAYGVATTAYTQYAGMPQATTADWSRLVFLVRQDHPAQAADLAIQAFHRFSNLEQLLFGLSLYAELGDFNAQARVFAELSQATLDQLVGQTRFLIMRAQYYQRQGKPELAWTDFRRALELSPNDTDTVLASMWFLIDGHRLDLLLPMTRAYTTRAMHNPAFWQALAAANQTLEHHKEAVIWYAKAAERNPDDYLMLLNYADALTRTGQVGMADRVRRHAWLKLKNKYSGPQPVMPSTQNTELLALARLQLMDQPGDPGLELVRQWVHQMRGLPDAPATEQTALLVLGWSILKDQFQNARSWMWQRYARQSQSAPPIWGESQTALQLHETQSMDRLLTRNSEALPIYNRYDMAYELGHIQQAVDIAFDGMSPQDDESMHDRYRQHVLEQAHYIQAEWNQKHQGALDSHDLLFETRLTISSQIQLTFIGTHQQQVGNDAVMQALTPNTDRLSTVQARWRHDRNETSLLINRHNELDGLTGFRLRHAIQWDARLNLEGGIDFRNESSVSLPMQVAGYENSIFSTASYTLGKREYVRIAPRYSRYFTQMGDELGTGKMLDTEWGYRIRTEYPDWRVRTFLNRQLFSPIHTMSASSLARLPTTVQSAMADAGIEPISYFLPNSSTNWGVCWSMGENVGGQNLQTTYTRAWLPFFDMCLDHNTVNGNGINGKFGLAGSVTGEDHFLIQLQSTDGTQPGSSPTHSLAVRYRRYF